MIRVSVLMFALSFSATSALAADPYPPQLRVSYLADAAPLVQHGATRLYYEMAITNFSKTRVMLRSVEALAGATRTELSGPRLAAAVRGAGPAAGDPLTLASGASAFIFMGLDLGAAKAPPAVGGVLHVADEQGGMHDIFLEPLRVEGGAPLIVGAPLRGAWIAGDSVSNQQGAAHRRAVLIDGGHAWLAQRYAIDWVQFETVGGKRTTWRGPENENRSYFCYNKPIYSVAAGTVVEATDSMPENVPHSGKYAVAIDFNTAAGNHVVVRIAPDRFVLYAHMRPGTVRVKAGQKVRVGDILGHVGNTGSSTEPHLHMHIDDQPSFLAGNGVPYEFSRGEASGAVVADVASPTVITLGPIGKPAPFANDYPAENALVVFK
ncbi:MAG TPA: M23 family metallopeptidase [Caulobacteraceae bacterium]